MQLRVYPHRASTAAAASALTLGECLRMGMILTLANQPPPPPPFPSGNANSSNQCDPLQAVTLALTLTFGVGMQLLCSDLLQQFVVTFLRLVSGSG